MQRTNRSSLFNRLTIIFDSKLMPCTLTFEWPWLHFTAIPGRPKLPGVRLRMRLITPRDSAAVSKKAREGEDYLKKLAIDQMVTRVASRQT
jgi:hypothetical protein